MTGARGESIVQVDGREVRILFTNRALANAERAIGRSILAVAQGFARGESGIGDVAQLLLVGIEAARQDARITGRATTLNDAYTLMDAVGFAQAANAVMEAVAAVIQYGTESDEADAEVPKATADNLST